MEYIGFLGFLLVLGSALGMFSSRRDTRAVCWRHVLNVPPRCSTRAGCWPRARNVLPALQYACRSLAARAECCPRAAIRVPVVGCARGILSTRRNTREDCWQRARNVLCAPQYACGILAMRTGCSSCAATRRRIVACTYGYSGDLCLAPPPPTFPKKAIFLTKKGHCRMAFFGQENCLFWSSMGGHPSFMTKKGHFGVGTSKSYFVNRRVTLCNDQKRPFS